MSRPRSGGPISERFGFITSILVALIVVWCGIYLAITHGDAHWVNRSGAAVVAVQAVAATLDYSRRNRLQRVARTLTVATSQPRLPPGGRRPASRLHVMEEEVGRSERHAFVVVIALAAFGEVLHGFGDLLFHLLLDQ